MTIRSRDELEQELRALGIRCSVEGFDALAVVVPDAGERSLENNDIRHRAIGIARSHGFSHLAVELRESTHVDPNRASLSRD